MSIITFTEFWTDEPWPETAAVVGTLDSSGWHVDSVEVAIRDVKSEE